MKRTTFLRLASVISLLCMWAMTPVVANAAEAPELPALDMDASTIEAAVGHSQITISLTVYISSMLATASFTWAVAQHDSRREKRISELEDQLAALFTHLRTLADDDDQDSP